MQTYISTVYDKDDKMIDFERWSYKKINTVIKNLKLLYKASFYKTVLKDAKYITIEDNKSNIIIIDINKIMED